MSKTQFTSCDGLDADANQCGSVTQSVSSWITIATRGERFDYCSVDCFRSFMAHLKRLYPGVV